MPDALTQAIATDGLLWLGATIMLCGIVRGFTGFGTALIFVPVAGQFLAPADIILVVAVTGIFSTFALLPRAWRRADKVEVGTLALAAVFTVPLGVWLMTQMDNTAVRWIVCGFASITLIAIVSGWRWQGDVATKGRLAIGGGAGIMGGITGITGPIVIMFYLASHRAAELVRANTILFLGILDVGLIVTLLMGGFVNAVPVVLGILLAGPYLLTSLIGQALFDPSYERVYRWAAYCVIALAVVSGAPVFD